MKKFVKNFIKAGSFVDVSASDRGRIPFGSSKCWKQIS